MKFVSDHRDLVVFNRYTDQELCKFENHKHETDNAQAIEILDTIPGVRRDTEVVEIPVRNMTIMQLRVFAEENDIDIPGDTEEKDEIRDLVLLIMHQRSDPAWEAETEVVEEIQAEAPPGAEAIDPATDAHLITATIVLDTAPAEEAQEAAAEAVQVPAPEKSGFKAELEAMTLKEMRKMASDYDIKIPREAKKKKDVVAFLVEEAYRQETAQVLKEEAEEEEEAETEMADTAAMADIALEEAEEITPGAEAIPVEIEWVEVPETQEAEALVDNPTDESED